LGKHRHPVGGFPAESGLFPLTRKGGGGGAQICQFGGSSVALARDPAADVVAACLAEVLVQGCTAGTGRGSIIAEFLDAADAHHAAGLPAPALSPSASSVTLAVSPALSVPA
jgi:hypothetical protein